jgi:hypothetical protein
MGDGRHPTTLQRDASFSWQRLFGHGASQFSTIANRAVSTPLAG